MTTRRYFQSPEKWTSDRDEAYDFGVVSRAMKLARKLRTPDLELVLSLDGPEPVNATPFENFLLGLLPPKSNLKEQRKCRFA